jgi:hypothetical protein
MLSSELVLIFAFKSTAASTKRAFYRMIIIIDKIVSEYFWDKIDVCERKKYHLY